MKTKSSFIKAFKHNPERKDLVVEMKNGTSYVYTPVSTEFFEVVDSWPSKGEAYNLFVKRNKALTSLKVLS